jgi:hypothetical protein
VDSDSLKTNSGQVWKQESFFSVQIVKTAKQNSLAKVFKAPAIVFSLKMALLSKKGFQNINNVKEKVAIDFFFWFFKNNYPFFTAVVLEKQMIYSAVKNVPKCNKRLTAKIFKVF